MNDYQYSGVPDRTKIANFHCPNCGAVVNSEVCPYCQAATGINTWKADMDDNVLLNGVPAQIVKLLVHTKQGPRFILYQLGDIKHPYKINSKIKLKAFKDMFLIMDDTKEYF